MSEPMGKDLVQELQNVCPSLEVTGEVAPGEDCYRVVVEGPAEDIVQWLCVVTELLSSPRKDH